MSKNLLHYAMNYYLSGVDTETFVEEFITRWEKERDGGLLSRDDGALDICLSNIFYAVDMYDIGETDFGSPELNKDHLRSEIGKQVHDLIRTKPEYRKVYETVEAELKQ